MSDRSAAGVVLVVDGERIPLELDARILQEIRRAVASADSRTTV